MSGEKHIPLTPNGSPPEQQPSDDPDRSLEERTARGEADRLRRANQWQTGPRGTPSHPGRCPGRRNSADFRAACRIARHSAKQPLAGVSQAAAKSSDICHAVRGYRSQSELGQVCPCVVRRLAEAPAAGPLRIALERSRDEERLSARVLQETIPANAATLSNFEVRAFARK